MSERIYLERDIVEDEVRAKLAGMLKDSSLHFDRRVDSVAEFDLLIRKTFKTIITEPVEGFDDAVNGMSLFGTAEALRFDARMSTPHCASSMTMLAMALEQVIAERFPDVVVERKPLERYEAWKLEQEARRPWQIDPPERPAKFLNKTTLLLSLGVALANPQFQAMYGELVQTAAAMMEAGPVPEDHIIQVPFKSGTVEMGFFQNGSRQSWYVNEDSVPFLREQIVRGPQSGVRRGQAYERARGPLDHVAEATSADGLVER